MKYGRFQLNGLSTVQWDALTALSESSGLSRSGYVRSVIQEVLERGYVVEATTERQRFKDGWRMRRNWTIRCHPLLLADIDRECQRFGISSRMQYVYNVVAWAIETEFILGEP